MISLSPYQSRVAEKVAQGKTTPEIAAELGKSYESVKVALTQVYRKAGLNDWGNSRVRLALLWINKPDAL